MRALIEMTNGKTYPIEVDSMGELTAALHRPEAFLIAPYEKVLFNKAHICRVTAERGGF